MATLTISINSGSGTTSSTATFAGPDALRILQAYRNDTQVLDATQQQLNDDILSYVKRRLTDLVVRRETVTPTIELT